MKHTIQSEDVFELARLSFGLVPPMIKEMAQYSTAVSHLYVSGVVTMESSMFDVKEINAIELRISVLNKCESCRKGHSYLAKQSGMDEADMQAIIKGTDTGDAGMNRLMKATNLIHATSRQGFEPVLTELSMLDISRQEVYEIIGLLSLKTISNNINNYLRALKATKF